MATTVTVPLAPADNDCAERCVGDYVRHDDALGIETDARMLTELVIAVLNSPNGNHVKGREIWPHAIDIEGFVERHSWHDPKAMSALASALYEAWMSKTDLKEIKALLRPIARPWIKMADQGLL